MSVNSSDKTNIAWLKFEHLYFEIYLGAHSLYFFDRPNLSIEPHVAFKLAVREFKEPN